MTSIHCVQEKMQIPVKIEFLGFWHTLDEKGGNLQFLNNVWHNIIKNMYKKEEYNQKICKTCQNPSIFKISGFSLKNGYKLMKT